MEKKAWKYYLLFSYTSLFYFLYFYFFIFKASDNTVDQNQDDYTDNTIGEKEDQPGDLNPDNQSPDDRIPYGSSPDQNPDNQDPYRSSPDDGDTENPSPEDDNSYKQTPEERGRESPSPDDEYSYGQNPDNQTPDSENTYSQSPSSQYPYGETEGGDSRSPEKTDEGYPAVSTTETPSPGWGNIFGSWPESRGDIGDENEPTPTGTNLFAFLGSDYKVNLFH